VLTKLGVKKRFHAEFDEEEAVHVYRRMVSALASLSPAMQLPESPACS
jgi:uncharacterized metal-binding protein